MDHTGASAREGRPDSASLCPGCGKSIDPLRAGHVAVLDGQFRYFCDRSCKAAHIEALSKTVAIEATTAAPPIVAFGEPKEPLPEANGAQGSSGETVAEADDAAEIDPDAPEPEAPMPLVPMVAAADVEERGPPEPIDSSAMRTAAIATRDAAAPRAKFVMLARALVPVGIGAGVLAAAVTLAGDTAAATARFPLTLIAAGSLSACFALRTRDASDLRPAVALVPPLVATLAATLARLSGDARAGSIAAFAGLACAAVIAVDLLLSRSRWEIATVRAHIARALDVRARVIRGEATVDVAASEVKPGEQVVVVAGDVVGVDAIVAAGEADVIPWIDAPIEMKKREGDAVVAGATILNGKLRLTTTFSGADRAWNKLVLSPQLRVDVAAPLVVGTRKAATRGVPLVSALVGGAVYASNGTWTYVLAAAAAAALASAAAALVGAVALGHARGQLAALQRGIVYKDASAFDAGGRTDVGVVCSRGTVLQGEPEIVALEAFGSIEVGRVLALAAGAETASTHPFAAAILRSARTRGERPENVRSALVHSGLGVTALAASGERLVIGSVALLLKEQVSVALADARVAELEAQGRSVLLVALAGKLIGLLGLQDGLRPGARAAVQRLLDARIEPVLLSGEARETCETIGRALDIDHVRPEILPSDRGAEVRALAEGGHVVAVLGHPSSDDGALGAADVSVAMSAAGATPGEWAIALASDDVRDAALALSLAHATRDRAKLALLFGAVPSVLAVLTIAFGLAPLHVAPLATIVAAAAALTRVRDLPMRIPPAS